MNIILTQTQFRNLLNEISQADIEERVYDANSNPTDGQISANNYKHSHIYVRGMGISIENPKGSVRKWKGKDGKEGKTIMKNHYGYFKNTDGNGKDGDAVDVFIGNHIDDFEYVFVVDQRGKDGKFDESKVMLGFLSKEEAKKAYQSNYDKNWHGFMAITKVSLPIFKKWLYRGNKQQKPFKDYVLILKNKLREKASK
jgi:hypothetical protein